MGIFAFCQLSVWAYGNVLHSRPVELVIKSYRECLTGD